MTDIQLFPDAEAMVITTLKDAGICSGRIYSSRPRTVVLPLIVVQRLGGVPSDRRYADNPSIQCDVWGNNKSEARSIAQAARTAIHQAEGDLFEEFAGYILAVEDWTGLTFLPDPISKEDRYIFAVQLTTRAWKSRWTT